jgi:hypothetical protein
MSVEDDTRAWLRERGAEAVEHPGGTLYAHLSRVHDRLGRLGLDSDLRLAGLAHAAYGTDGFGVALLDPKERSTLRDIIGAPAEQVVYRYGSCDRRRTWPYLARTGAIWDRFTDEVEMLPAVPLRAFVDLTIVNELDVVEQAPAVAEKHGGRLRELFSAWASAASAAVMADAQRVLAF